MFADRCVECKKFHVAYMVRQEVWKEARLGEEGCCLDCLQERLGRELTGADLDLHSPCNLFLPMSDESLRLIFDFQFGQRGSLGQLPKRKYSNLLRAVRQTRRKNPNGLTFSDVSKWLRETLGVQITTRDIEEAKKARQL